MPRKPRELCDGGIYHVFNRGNDRRQLFAEEADYQCFLNHLGRGLTHYRSALYHYCLMPNHFHVLLKIQDRADLPGLMHRLQLAYARYFKKTRAFVGHVFQERFRSPRIAEESDYLQCGRYIERNPVKAQLVPAAEAYPYSSAACYVRGTEDPLLTPNPYDLQMGATPDAGNSATENSWRSRNPMRPCLMRLSQRSEPGTCGNGTIQLE